MSLTSIQKKQIIQIAKKMNIEYFYLFGSQARGKTKPMSDFDFAAKFSNRTKNLLRARLKLMNELSGVLKRDDIDVVNIGEADPMLHFNIIKDGIVIYEKNHDKRVMDRVMAMKKFYDRDYYYRRHYAHTINKLSK